MPMAASASMSFTLPVSTKSFMYHLLPSSRRFLDAVRLSTYVPERQTRVDRDHGVYVLFSGADMRVTKAGFGYRCRGERLECGIGRLPAQDQITGNVGLRIRLPDETDATLVSNGDEPHG